MEGTNQDQDTIELSQSPRHRTREILSADEATLTNIERHRHAEDDDLTLDSFHTALETQRRSTTSPRTKIPNEEKNEITRRTYLMIFLIIANEILVLGSMISLLVWLVTYRGGLEFLDAFRRNSTRKTEHCITLHAVCMAACFALFKPQFLIVRIVFERFSEGTKLNLELALRICGLVAFGFGLQQVVGLPPTVLGPDNGIHLVFGVIAIIVYLLHALNFVLGTLDYYCGEVKCVVVIGCVIRIFLNFQLVETLGHLVDMLAFLALLTGYLSCIIALFMSSKDPPILENISAEEDAYLLHVVFLTFMYLTSACIVYYHHYIEQHHGIITYMMYKNVGIKRIAAALEEAKDTAQEVKQMKEVEYLCQYENPDSKTIADKGTISVRKRVLNKSTPLLPLVDRNQ